MMRRVPMPNTGGLYVPVCTRSRQRCSRIWGDIVCAMSVTPSIA
jgi:hypothetical protein